MTITRKRNVEPIKMNIDSEGEDEGSEKDGSEEDYSDYNDESDYESDYNDDDSSDYESDSKPSKKSNKTPNKSQPQTTTTTTTTTTTKTPKKKVQSIKIGGYKPQSEMNKSKSNGKQVRPTGLNLEHTRSFRRDNPMPLQIPLKFDYDAVRKIGKSITKRKVGIDSDEEDYGSMFVDESEGSESDIEDNLNTEGQTVKKSRTTTSTSTVFKPKTKSKRERKIKDLIAAANDQYAMGEYELSKESFMEVIKIAPNNHYPYAILSKIYEHNNEPEQALSLLAFAAIVKKTDPELWKRCSRMAQSMGKQDKAILFLSKAIKLDGQDDEAHWQKSMLLIENQDYKKAIQELEILDRHRPNDPQVTQEYARVLNLMDKLSKGIEVLERFIQEDLKLSITEISLDNVNLLMEFYNKSKEYNKTISLYQKISSKFPDDLNLPIDFIYNACIAYFAMGNHLEIAENLLKKILSNDVMQIHDIFYDLAEKLFFFGEVKHAVTLYLKLVTHPMYTTASVYARLAHCYKSLKNYPLAINYYKKSLELVPGNVNTIVGLSECHREMGDSDEALNILDQSENMQSKNKANEKEIFQNVLNDLESKRQKKQLTHEEVKNYLDQAYAYLNLSKYNQFLGISLALFNGSQESKELRESRGKRLILSSRFTLSIPNGKKKRRSRRRKDLNDDDDENNNENDNNYENIYNKTSPFAEILNEDEYFKLIFDTTRVLIHMERYFEGSLILHYICRNIKFQNDSYNYPIHNLNCIFAYNSKNYIWAYQSAKYMMENKPNTTLAWNLFNRILFSTGSPGIDRSGTFITMISEKNKDSIPMNLLVGNLSRVSGSSTGALFDYLRALKLNEEEPLTHFLIGTLILAGVMNRRLLNRHKMVTSSFAFLYRYSNLRFEREPQEVNYNLGRSFHQLGIYHLAVDHYKKVLESKDDPDPNFNLKKEAAFNLSLIYKNNGNLQEANKLIFEYLEI